MSLQAKYIHISGLVQGVGFRPFIYRCATELGLCGWVRNYSGGVEIFIEGPADKCSRFTGNLKKNAPPASDIFDIWQEQAKPEKLASFEIKPSLNGANLITGISPDIAVCGNCLQDMKNQPRRISYPFTNCTHCGPRFSILRDIPYDRPNTSMHHFQMCEKCKQEYEDVFDRRFHAQPVSCDLCGPQYFWKSLDVEISAQQKILARLADAIHKGAIIALKGVGGYHLVCDAQNEDPVRRLRRIKNRHSRPFALMFADLKSIQKYAYCNDFEKEMLLSWRRPVVILNAFDSPSAEVNKGFSTLGVLLPYTPLHHLLMERLDLPAVVFTSANRKGQPLIAGNEQVDYWLNNYYCDAVLSHNISIVHKQDDSIVKEAAGKPLIIRRSRGYVPQPVMMKQSVDGILAMGADLNNAFGIGKGHKAILSPYMGDLGDYDVFSHYKESIREFRRLFRFSPRLIARDLHPGYHSSGLAEKIYKEEAEKQDIKLVSIQHHHAHIASVMAEHGLNDELIGVAMDGTGYGDAEIVRGSEFMVCDLKEFDRWFHLKPMLLPGGEKAIHEPWRIALATLYHIYGEPWIKQLPGFLESIEHEHKKYVLRALRKQINIVHSCGIGRLFDVVAVLLGLIAEADFDGEGPVKLENIRQDADGNYPVIINEKEFLYVPVIKGVVEDLQAGLPREKIAGRFHNTIAAMISTGIDRINARTGLEKVALSGGMFQNGFISSKVMDDLTNRGYRVFINRNVPCNDGGIALGQMAIAAKKWNYVFEYTGKNRTNQ